MALSEDELLAGIKAGQGAVIEAVYVAYFAKVGHWITQNSGTLEEAKDVFQDALVVVYEQLQRHDFAIQRSFKSYLWGICRNLWLKRLRDDRVLRHATDEALPNLADEQADALPTKTMREQLYRRYFMNLGGQCREILQRFLQGESLRHIAHEMSLSSESYAKKRKFQCKEQLIKQIKQDPAYQQLMP